MAKPYEFGSVEVVTKTDKAVLVRALDSDTVEEDDEVWIPFSCIHEDSRIDFDSDTDEDGQLVVTEWFARERGWT